MSQASKDVMDSIKHSASLIRSEYPPSSAESKSGQILKETMSQTYRGVPSSLEAESLQSKLTVQVYHSLRNEQTTKSTFGGRNNKLTATWQFNYNFYLFIDF